MEKQSTKFVWTMYVYWHEGNLSYTTMHKKPARMTYKTSKNDNVLINNVSNL